MRKFGELALLSTMYHEAAPAGYRSLVDESGSGFEERFVEELTTPPVVEDTAPLFAVPMPESRDERSVDFAASFTADVVLTTMDPRSLLLEEAGEPSSILQNADCYLCFPRLRYL